MHRHTVLPSRSSVTAFIENNTYIYIYIYTRTYIKHVFLKEAELSKIPFGGRFAAPKECLDGLGCTQAAILYVLYLACTYPWALVLWCFGVLVYSIYWIYSIYCAHRKHTSSMMK